MPLIYNQGYSFTDHVMCWEPLKCMWEVSMRSIGLSALSASILIFLNESLACLLAVSAILTLWECCFSHSRYSQGCKARFAKLNYVKKMQALPVNAMSYHLLVYNAINMCLSLQCFFLLALGLFGLYFWACSPPHSKAYIVMRSIQHWCFV